MFILLQNMLKQKKNGKNINQKQSRVQADAKLAVSDKHLTENSDAKTLI